MPQFYSKANSIALLELAVVNTSSLWFQEDMNWVGIIAELLLSFFAEDVGLWF